MIMWYIRRLAYENPVFFDRIRQIVYILRSWISGVSYPRYFDARKEIGTFCSDEGLAHSPELGEGKDGFLFFVHWFEVGGAESFALEMMRFLKAEGKKVYAFSTVSASNTKLEWFSRACDVVVDLPQLLGDNDWQAYVFNFIRERDVGVIYIHHSVFAYDALCRIKRQFPWIKVIDTTHIVEPLNGGFVHLSARMSEFIDRHHVITPSLQSYYVHKLKVSGNKVQFFPLSFMSKDFVTDGLDPYRNVGRSVKIVFLGRISQQKRPYLFVEIAKRISRKLIEMEINPIFEIYGDGPQLSILRKHINKSGLKNIRVCGEHFDKIAIFRDAFALVLPSENEGLPLVAFEATRAGVFTFATDVGQNRDFLSEAFLSPSLRSIGLGDKVVDAIINKEKYAAEFAIQRKLLASFDDLTMDYKVIRNFLYAD